MKPRDITLAQITYTFVPFALLLSAALLAAEATLDLPNHRMIYSIWVSLALAIPATCLYILNDGRQSQYNYATVLWTFAYCAYLVHFYYAVFVHYHGSVSEVFSHQGLKIAGPNFLVTALWGFDVITVWVTDSTKKWVRIERAFAHFLVFAIFFVSSVVIFKGFVNVLGYTMTAAVAVSLAIRLIAKRMRAPAVMETISQ